MDFIVFCFNDFVYGAQYMLIFTTVGGLGSGEGGKRNAFHGDP